MVISSNKNLSNTRLASFEKAELTDTSMSISKSECNAVVEDSSSKKINWGFYAAFAVATIAITKFFTSHKYFTEGNSLMGYNVVIVSLFFFVVSCFFMAFEIYAEEKEKNNLRVSFPVFEFLYRKLKVKDLKVK